eukprot:1153317-Amphidinium_carterae.1
MVACHPLSHEKVSGHSFAQTSWLLFPLFLCKSEMSLQMCSVGLRHCNSNLLPSRRVWHTRAKVRLTQTRYEVEFLRVVLREKKLKEFMLIFVKTLGLKRGGSSSAEYHRVEMY